MILRKLLSRPTLHVVLHRAPHKADVTYPEEPVMRAWRRAHVLACLHGCRLTQGRRALHVWAEPYYRNPENAIRFSITSEK